MEMHPGWRNDKMLEACKKNGIHVTVIYTKVLNKGRDNGCVVIFGTAVPQRIAVK